MRKHAETFHTSKGYRQTDTCHFYTNFAGFKIEICGIFFECYLNENEALDTHTYYMKINHFNVAFI